MGKASEPKITDAKESDFTCVTFEPDLSKFKMDKLDQDVVDLFTRRAYDIAAATKGVKVILNGKRLPVCSRALPFLILDGDCLSWHVEKYVVDSILSLPVWNVIIVLICILFTKLVLVRTGSGSATGKVIIKYVDSNVHMWVIIFTPELSFESFFWFCIITFFFTFCFQKPLCVCITSQFLMINHQVGLSGSAKSSLIRRGFNNSMKFLKLCETFSMSSVTAL